MNLCVQVEPFFFGVLYSTHIEHMHLRIVCNFAQWIHSVYDSVNCFHAGEWGGDVVVNETMTLNKETVHRGDYKKREKKILSMLQGRKVVVL